MSRQPITLENKDFNLNEREELFCREYIRLHFNGTKAAVAAGYAAGKGNASARVQAARLLAKDNIRGYIQHLQSNLAAQADIHITDLIKALKAVGLADITEAFNEDGNLKPISQLPQDLRAALAGVDIAELYAGDTPIGQTKKIRTHDKIGALNLLAKLLGYVNSSTSVNVKRSAGNDGEDDDSKDANEITITIVNP